MNSLIERSRLGDEDASQQLLRLVDAEMWKRMDAHVGKTESEVTLHAPTLVKELYGELQAERDQNPKNREHFSGLALIALRARLADNARKASAGRSDIRHADRVVFGGVEDRGLHLIHPDLVRDLTWMLDDLEVARPDLKTVAECRFLFGMTEGETVDMLDLSADTVKRRTKEVGERLDDLKRAEAVRDAAMRESTGLVTAFFRKLFHMT